MNNKTNQAVSNSDGQQATLGTELVRILKLGLDMHYRQVTVAMQEGEGRIKIAGKMSHEEFEAWVGKKLAEGWQIKSTYEAGASGYWLHRELGQKGVENLVVVPKAMGKGGKRQKTDRRDSVALVDALDRYLRGREDALSVVSVPSIEQEENRALIRRHRRIMTDRGRNEARGKGLLCAQGIEIRGTWWQWQEWEKLQSHPRLREWMKEQLEDLRKEILAAEEQQQALRKRIEALAPAMALPKGMGAYSAAVLEYEMKGWERFKNRRQVASYTGLCPGVHLSDEKGKEGAINHCGNPTVSWTLVEMVWRLKKWQPLYGPVRQLAAGLAKSKRARKRLVVMAARRLAIDLWRIRTGQCSGAKLGLIMCSR